MDANALQKMIGKRILIGFTYLWQDGSFCEQKQMHGTISRADQKSGFTVVLEGKRAGETYYLPPDANGFKVAPPGEYREHSTGDIVVNPDFISEWTVTKPDTPPKC